MSDSKTLNNYILWLYHHLPDILGTVEPGSKVNLNTADINEIWTVWKSQFNSDKCMDAETYHFIMRMTKNIFCNKIKVGKIFEVLATHASNLEMRGIHL